jgi:hypothetical protein
MHFLSTSRTRHIFLSILITLLYSFTPLLAQSQETEESGKKVLVARSGDMIEVSHPLQFGEDGHMGFHLMNEAGEMLFSQSLYGDCGQKDVRIIPIGKLEPGIYILLEHDGSRRKTETVIIVEP